ncbi:MAG: hypothetical protein BAA04_09860 [Firmicutes bacterium ZCTH02-B6]|nr:MAG: hypothetical protein BAA04_09860 [Firmicutes bacterium ZCTH02-B6]
MDGHVALVTGASRNIGRAIAVALAEHGADVAVCARDLGHLQAVADEIRGMGRRALAVAADVSDPAQVVAMVGQVEEQLGPVDILVNNVGVRPKQSVLEMSFDDWDRIIRVNLSSAFYCAKAVVPRMVEKRTGRIINISGRSGFSGQADRAHVVASKAGMHGLTKALAHELAAYGITVNTVSPGHIETTRPADSPPIADAAQLVKGVPLGRLGLPQEIAAACVYLASPAAAYVTGQVLHVNGGAFMI